MVSMSGKSGNVLELESGEGNVGQLTECRGGDLVTENCPLLASSLGLVCRLVGCSSPCVAIVKASSAY